MTQHATSWDALLRTRLPIRLAPAPAAEALQARAGCKLSELLEQLAGADSLPTLSLAVAADLDSRQVWGLLKAPRQRGQVRFDGGRWSLNPNYPGHAIQRAADLLRAAGWTVEPPTRGDA